MPTESRRSKPRGRGPETAAKLVAAAAHAFNSVGYQGTDSNRIARAAGYAPATFYKHFDDKRAIFLAAYERWVTNEWAAIEREAAKGGDARKLVAGIVDLVLEAHRRGRGLRSSLLAFLAADAEVRRFYRAQRRRQLAMFENLRARLRAAPRTAAEDAVLLFTLERTSDAVANGEVADLGLDRKAVRGALCARILAHLRP